MINEFSTRAMNASCGNGCIKTVLARKADEKIAEKDAELVNIRAELSKAGDFVRGEMIRQSELIAKLRAELAEIKQEVSQAGYLGGPSLSACVNAMSGHLREMKDKLAAIKAAPTEAYMMLVVGRDNDYTKYVRLMPYDGPQLELIARPK